jgi:hypothetical protein
MEFLGFHFSVPLDKILRVADTLESVREYVEIEKLLVDRARACHFACASVGDAAEAYQ